MLLELLSDLDVLVQYEGDQYLVPCLLPENRPDHVELFCEGGVSFGSKSVPPLLHHNNQQGKRELSSWSAGKKYCLDV